MHAHSSNDEFQMITVDRANSPTAPAHRRLRSACARPRVPAQLSTV